MYYVTAIQDSRVYWLAGPIADHETALGLVDRVRREAVDRDPFLHFAAFGTARRKAAPYPAGALNQRLGVIPYG